MSDNEINAPLIRTSYKTLEADLRKRIITKELEGRFPSSRELAKSYGCSINTVEKALRELEESGFIIREQRKGTKINPELKLNTRSGLVASFVVSIDNPMWASAQRGIEDYIRKLGFSMIASSHDMDSEKCRQTLDNLSNVAVDGVIMAPVDHDEETKSRFLSIISSLLKQGIKVVLIDRYLHDLSVPYVSSDNIGSSYKLTKLLIEAGHRKIGFVRTSRVSTVEERLAGFRQACFEQGLKDSDVHDFMISTSLEDFKDEIGVFKEKLKKLLQGSDVTALFTANDQVFKGVEATLSDMGLSVSGDISLVTFDASNIQESRPYKITGVKQNFYAMGRLAAELLVNQIYSGTEEIQIGHIFPADIVIGNTISSPRQNKEDLKGEKKDGSSDDCE